MLVFFFAGKATNSKQSSLSPKQKMANSNHNKPGFTATSRKNDGEEEEEVEVVEEEISEVLDDILNSGGDDPTSTVSDQPSTRDESFSEARSLRADYAEKV